VVETLTILAGLCWLVTVIHDVKSREVPTLFLAGLALVSLIGRAWPWWVLTALALLWPSRQRSRSIVLAPIAVVVGLVTGEPFVAMALVMGSVGWALRWWGGADGIVLLALALRHGREGLYVGLVFAVVVGLFLMIARKRSGWEFVTAASGILSRRVLDENVPPESEMPAAAALAAGGLTMEVIELWTVMTRMFG